VTDAEALRSAQAALWDELAELNRRNQFRRAHERPEEDRKRGAAISRELQRLSDEYDAAHPLPPCEACGATRHASTLDLYPSKYTCHMIARCVNAPRVMGG